MTVVPVLPAQHSAITAPSRQLHCKTTAQTLLTLHIHCITIAKSVIKPLDGLQYHCTMAPSPHTSKRSTQDAERQRGRSAALTGQR